MLRDTSPVVGSYVAPDSIARAPIVMLAGNTHLTVLSFVSLPEMICRKCFICGFSYSRYVRSWL